MRRRELIDVALGNAPADKVVRGGKFVNVLTAEIYPGDVAIKGDRIAYVGNVEHTIGSETEVIDAAGRFVTPGLIDTHQHSYSAHINMTEYARLLLLHGTTTITDAFYGVGNVCGIDAVRFSLDEIVRTPLKVVFLQPSLSYLQNTDVGLPSTPMALTQEQLWEILDWPECRGLEEPPFPVIVKKDPFWLDMFEEALCRGMLIMGHGTSITQRELAAYLCMGAISDHSGADRDDALMKLRMGCRLNAREGSAARNLQRVMKARSEHRLDGRGFTFCGDEVEFLRMVRQGHVDYDIRLAIGQGIEPITAIQMATINAAELLRVIDDSGVLSPGKYADILLVEDVAEFRVQTVVANGQVVARDGRFLLDLPRPTYPAYMYGTVKLERVVRPEDFIVPAPPGRDRARVRCMYFNDGSVLSYERHLELACRDGDIPPDIEQDALKIAMVDRYGRGHQVGVGFIQGFELKEGAIATTYSPQTENIILIGTSNRDLAVAANEIARMDGGFVAVRNGEVVGRFPTPLCSLLYDGSLEMATEQMEALYAEVARLGYRKKSSPFHMLGFMGPCSDIKFLKITPEGVFNMAEKRYVPVVLDNADISAPGQPSPVGRAR